MVKNENSLLVDTLSSFRKNRILLIGDLVLDTYTKGNITRISPEAPVPVLQVTSKSYKAGMAGNVALNLAALGQEVILLGRVGDDEAGKMLIHALEQGGIDTSLLLIQPSYKTPVKNRFIADSQQMLRVDEEHILPLCKEEEEYLIGQLHAPREVTLVSDYAKGLLSSSLLQAIFASTTNPVIVDPKGSDFCKYQGATIIKPNLSEALKAANVEKDLDLAAERLIKQTGIKMLFVTRAGDGISLFTSKGRHDFTVTVRTVKDVTGAGDTVLAMLGTALACGFSYEQAALFANIAAGIAIEQFGCAEVTLAQVARELLKQNVANKIFQQEHLFALQMAMHNRPHITLTIDGKEGFSPRLLQEIRKAASKTDGELILHITSASEELLQLLASLQETDFIVSAS